MSTDVPLEALLKEYELLRQEIVGALQRAWHLRLALFSSTAILFGFTVIGRDGSLSPMALTVPFLLILLCQFGIVTVRDTNLSVTVKSIYIAQSIEAHPRVCHALRWEGTCPKIYDTLRKETFVHLLMREPIPWLSLVVPTSAWGIGCAYRFPNELIMWGYIVPHWVLFVLLVWQIRYLRWPDREDLKDKILATLAPSATPDGQPPTSGGHHPA